MLSRWTQKWECMAKTPEWACLVSGCFIQTTQMVSLFPDGANHAINLYVDLRLQNAGWSSCDTGEDIKGTQEHVQNSACSPIGWSDMSSALAKPDPDWLYMLQLKCLFSMVGETVLLRFFITFVSWNTLGFLVLQMTYLCCAPYSERKNSAWKNWHA